MIKIVASLDDMLIIGSTKEEAIRERDSVLFLKVSTQTNPRDGIPGYDNKQSNNDNMATKRKDLEHNEPLSKHPKARENNFTEIIKLDRETTSNSDSHFNSLHANKSTTAGSNRETAPEYEI